jgi:pimeloyl-ACP methyl ester carboxylesterase
MPETISDGLRIHYEVAGSGEPLVLYHGLTGSGERWRDTGYVAGLSETYRLILVDARSSTPEGTARATSRTIGRHMGGAGRRPTSWPC